MPDLSRRPLGRTGIALTEASFGCAAIAGLYRACPEDQAQATLQTAWDAGIRYFDTAPFYGHGLSEERLGRFLAGKPREEVVISTKVGRLIEPAEGQPDHGFIGGHPARVWFDYSGKGIRRAFEGSLTRLGLSRVDILYVHDIGSYAHGPEAARHMADLEATGFETLEAMKAEGLIGAWGLGVNEVEVCLDILARRPLDVVLLAGRFTLLDRRGARLLPALKAAGGGLVAGGVFNSGILATGPVPGATFDYAPAPPDILDRVRGIAALCKAEGQDMIGAALRFPLSDPVVASTLIGAATPASLSQNLAAFACPTDPAIFARTMHLALT